MRKPTLTNTKCKVCEKPLIQVSTSTKYCSVCGPIARREYNRIWVNKKRELDPEIYRQADLKYKKKINDRDTKIGVYCVINKIGEIIYVGRTDNFPRRIRRHRTQKSLWLNEEHKIKFIPYNTFGDSLVAEAILIRDHQPKYNRDGVIR